MGGRHGVLAPPPRVDFSSRRGGGIYGHDGRGSNLREVILRHGGEARAARDAFAALSPGDQLKLIEFLNSLVIFPPDDTASNLDPGDRNAAGLPAIRTRER